MASEIDLTGVEDDLNKLQEDEHVRKALDEGVDLRAYSNAIEAQLREAEDDAIQQFIQNSDCVADLFFEIQTCDAILGSMETMLKGFQESLGGISADIKTLQTKSLSMNVKLKNRREAEKKLSQYIQAVVVSPTLVKAIVEGPIDERYVNHLVQLNAKIEYVRNPPPKMQGTAAQSLAATSQQIETLRKQAISRVRQFLIDKIKSLQDSKTNIQNKQSMLLRYKYFNEFLSEHDQTVAEEIRTFYTATMSALLSNFFQGYISDINNKLRAKKLEPLTVADKTDLLCTEISRSGGLFASKKTEQHVVNVHTLGDRNLVLSETSGSPLLRHGKQGGGRPIGYEDIWNCLLHLLVNTAASEFVYLHEFFNNRNLFTVAFEKTIGLFTSNLEQYLATSYDIIGIILAVRVCEVQRNTLNKKRNNASVHCLDSMFDRFARLIWPRFKTVFDMHLASIASLKPTSVEVSANAVCNLTRRFAALCHSLVALNAPPLTQEEFLRTSLSRLRNDFISALNQISTSLPAGSSRLVFLINQLEYITLALQPYPGSDEFAAFDQLSVQHVAAYADTALSLVDDFRKMMTYVKSEAADATAASAVVRGFASRWRQGIESVSADICNGQFSGGGADKRWEDIVLKGVLTQLLTHYQKFDEVIRSQIKSSNPILEELVPIQTVVYEIKRRIRN
ncbi:Vacuolar protein sorting-associated protein [Plasmodiophora brassicae]